MKQIMKICTIQAFKNLREWMIKEGLESLSLQELQKRIDSLEKEE